MLQTTRNIDQIEREITIIWCASGNIIIHKAITAHNSLHISLLSFCNICCIYVQYILQINWSLHI